MRFECVAVRLFAFFICASPFSGQALAAEATSQTTGSETEAAVDLQTSAEGPMPDPDLLAEDSEPAHEATSESEETWVSSRKGASSTSTSTSTSAPEEGDAVVSAPAEGYAAPLPVSVSSGGAFSYSVPIKIPAFRGLEPKIKLSYGSSGSAFGSPHNIVGAGWRLSGFSEITRNSVGRGVPFFEDDQDIFMLDGQELLACNDAQASNKWTSAYPADWKTTVASASCTAGGNFAALTENYLKIKFKPNVNEWVVSRKDGTKMVYKPLSFFNESGDQPGGETEQAFVDGSRWLLYEITDTQTVPNVVTFEYDISSEGDAWSHAPSAVTYGHSKKHRVEFKYKGRNSLDYAVGRGWPRCSSS